MNTWMANNRVVEFSCHCQVPHKIAVPVGVVAQFTCPRCGVRFDFAVQSNGDVLRAIPAIQAQKAPPQPTKNLWERIAEGEDEEPV